MSRKVLFVATKAAHACAGVSSALYALVYAGTGLRGASVLRQRYARAPSPGAVLRPLGGAALFPHAGFRRQPRGLSPPEAAHRRRGLRPHPLQHAGGRAAGPSGGACGAQTRHARGLYGARVSFFHRRAAEKLAAVLPRGASAQPLDRPSHHHQRRGLRPREAVCRRPRGAGQRRGCGPRYASAGRWTAPRCASGWASAWRTPCSSPWASTASERTTKP